MDKANALITPGSGWSYEDIWKTLFCNVKILNLFLISKLKLGVLGYDLGDVIDDFYDGKPVSTFQENDVAVLELTVLTNKPTRLDEFGCK